MLLQKTSAVFADVPGGGDGSRPEHLYAFVRQLPFAAVTVALVTAYIVAAPAVFDDERVLIGLLVALAATALSLALPWHRMDLRWAGALPLLDIAAIGLVQAGGVGAASLLVLPVLWMSRAYGAAGVVVSVTGGTVAAWSTELPVPDLSALEVADLQRLFLLPLILLAVGVYLYVAERRSSARRDLLGRQSAVLERTLAGSRDQQRLLTTILDTIDVGVLVIGEDGRVARTNRMHTASAGGALDVGDRVDGRVPDRLRGYRADGRTPLATDELSTWLADEARDHELVWWDVGDGERRAYRVTARHLPGSQSGTVVAYHDLTAEMGALAQLEDFVSSVSHELRTPLTSVLGYLDLALDDDGLPDRARGHLQVVERNAARLLRMIGDLLTAAQTRRGQLLVHRTPTDLVALVAESVQNQGPRAAAAEVTVSVLAPEQLPVSGDRAQLLQVVDNLLTNAIKYSRPGGRVGVELTARDGAAALCVRDEGIGISAADQEKLFTRFFRADAVRRGPVQGTGLGLHISRQLVEAHGGRVAVASELDHGTAVTVTLPTATEEDA